MTKPAQPAKPIRCAIYTRKSSEDGLEQDFNSLHAQRGACSAYILSQAGENWTELATLYDDGGYSGGSMDRPALKRLLADIQARRVDVVVVYKVDRLTRSLGDFARIVEVFDQAGGSFVSVTQAFNTTTSMGRLTLNVLFSFAQFEREVTGERIRDKIAASKQKGMWMGGNVALGYDACGRTLSINALEAETVRMIFRRYLELDSVYQLKDELHQAGVVSKRCVAKSGNARGGVPINRGALFHLLRNRLYLGEIPHKDQWHPGQHPPILDCVTFDAVQAKLDETSARPPTVQGERRPFPVPAMPLAGRIFDSAGKPMSPVKSKRKGGATYRYYVSTACQVGEPDKAGSCPRIPAPLVEETVAARLRRLGLFDGASGELDWAKGRAVLRRIVVGDGQLVVTLDAEAMAAKASIGALRRKLLDGDGLATTEAGLVLTIPLILARTPVGVVAAGPEGGPAIVRPAIDKALYAALIRAETWKRRLFDGEVPNIDALAKQEGVAASFAGRMIRVAFLAPDLKRAVLDGRQPLVLNLQAIITRDLPMEWSAQRALFRA